MQTRNNSRLLTLAAVASLALSATALAQSPKMTYFGFSVVSDGRAYPHATSSQNGVLSHTYVGSSFQAGSLAVSGTATNVSYAGSSTHNHSGEMRIMVRNVTKGTSYTSFNIFTNFNVPWTTSTGNRTFDASALGTIDSGDVIQVRCFEAYDNSLVDSRWDDIVVQLYPSAPPTTGHTALDIMACPCPPVTSDDSDISVSLALFDTLGTLLESDSGDAGTAPEISLDGLPPGEYYVCCVSASSVSFEDGFSWTPGPGAGSEGMVRLRQGGAPFFEARVHDDGDTWHLIELTDSSCAADVDGDGAVALSDLARILADFGQVCP